MDHTSHPSVNPSPTPDASFPRSPGAEVSMARRLSAPWWEDLPISEEDDEPGADTLASTAELAAAAGTAAAATDAAAAAVDGPARLVEPPVIIPISSIEEWFPPPNAAPEQPRRSNHFEDTTGAPYVVDIHRVPTPRSPQSMSPPRRPYHGDADQSRGAIPRQPREARQRPIAVASTSGIRSSAPLMERDRSRSSRASLPPALTPLPRRPKRDFEPFDRSDEQGAARPLTLPAFFYRPRHTSPSGRLLSCWEVYREELRNRWPITFRPHVGPPTVPDQTRRPRKMRGCRFGNLRSISSDRTLDPPPHTCSNCRRNCKDGRGHKVLECPEAFVQHCENCGRRGVHVTDCPRCGETYFEDGYYLENPWAA